MKLRENHVTGASVSVNTVCPCSKKAKTTRYTLDQKDTNIENIVEKPQIFVKGKLIGCNFWK